MTNDEIIEVWRSESSKIRSDSFDGSVIRFARAIIAAERERCADIAQNTIEIYIARFGAKALDEPVRALNTYYKIKALI